MNKMNKIYNVSGILAILGGSVAIVGFILLNKIFGYPEIIRAEPSVLLNRLFDTKHIVPYLYYIGVGGAGLCIIFFSTLYSQIQIDRGENTYSSMGKISGIISGLLLYAGIIRYSILFPQLAVLRESNQFNNETIDLIFKAMNTYIGDSLAEHVQFTFSSLLVLFFSLSNLKTETVSKWISYFGFILTVILVIGNLEQFGLSFAFIFNRLGGDLLAIWLIINGISLCLKKNR